MSLMIGNGLEWRVMASHLLCVRVWVGVCVCVKVTSSKKRRLLRQKAYQDNSHCVYKTQINILNDRVSTIVHDRDISEHSYFAFVRASVILIESVILYFF